MRRCFFGGCDGRACGPSVSDIVVEQVLELSSALLSGSLIPWMIALATLLQMLQACGIPADEESGASFVRAYAWGEPLPAEIAIVIAQWWSTASDDAIRHALVVPKPRPPH
jgi:hypothetical protein